MNYSPKDIPKIQSVVEKFGPTSAGLDPEDYSIKNVRVSTKNVQMDIFVDLRDKSLEKQEGIARQVAQLFKADIGSLELLVNLTAGLTSGLDDRSIIQNTIEKFNDEKYWEAQEMIEAVWMKLKDQNERNVTQGLILVGAALVHHQRNQDKVCLSMFARALKKLEAVEGLKVERRSFLGIDLEHTITEVSRMVKEGKVRKILLRKISDSEKNHALK